VNNDSPVKALLVVVLVAGLSSALVSSTVVLLRPVQKANQWVESGQTILQLAALAEDPKAMTDVEMLELFQAVDVRNVDIASGEFVAGTITTGQEGRVTVYLVWQDQKFDRIILPVSGEGMWSTIHGYIALESDLNTIADVDFYEQNETPGLGDQITRPDWLARWKGRRIYDETGTLRFAVSGGTVDSASEAALYEVDALTGATVTADAVTALIHYWFGPSGYRPFLGHVNELLHADELIDLSASGGN